MRPRPVTAGAADSVRRAERLLRWYPPSWRARYGEEFAALLSSDIGDRPRSWRRTADVVRSAMVARLTRAGLSSHRLEPLEQMRASLACLGCTVAVFIAFAAALWAQLTVGWQWAPPDAIGTTAAMVVMSCVMVVLVALALLAAVPVGGRVLGHMVRRQAQGLVRPTLLFLSGAALLILGSRHFGNGWPGTGGHPWAHQGLVPGGVAAFLWASSLSISAYWAHPGALLDFPAAEVAWMVVSPLSLGAMVVGATKILRRVELSAGVLRYEGHVGRIAVAAMAVFVIGSCLWLVDGGAGPRNLFHAGAIDFAGLAMMTAAWVVAQRAAGGARRAGLRLGARA
jgi:hypothetical protein